MSPSTEGATAIVGTSPNRDATRAWPPLLIGTAKLVTMAFHGESVIPVASHLFDRINADSSDVGAMMDLATIFHVLSKRDNALSMQAEALAKEQIYRQEAVNPTADSVRLLVFAVPGDLMANMPIQFLLEDSDVTVDTVYVGPGLPFPKRLPEHDLALVAIAESDENTEILERVAALLDDPSQPAVLNAPRKVMALRRDNLWSLLKGAPGILIPATVRVKREAVIGLGLGETTLSELLPDGAFPIILRPIGSHAGKGLSKLDDAAAVIEYLAEQEAEEFYLSRYVDYQGADGLFRKYRIALIQGRPYVCHMAVSAHWMIHYLNADMRESAERRAEEAQAFARFDEDFATRHAVAFQSLFERVGLEYFAIDCAETRDGELLLFEADTAMIVHDMDPPSIFPYKGPQMRRVFDAFRAMLTAANAEGRYGPIPA